MNSFEKTPEKIAIEPLDCLAVAAHPDDAELFAGGTLALAARLGRRVGILDLTHGESATRGSADARAAEAAEATRILGLAARETLDLGDARLENSNEARRAVVEAIRRLRPRLILAPGPEDRHPDHRRAHELVRDAAFFAHVGNYPAAGPRWRVEAVAYYPGNTFNPEGRVDWVVDVSATFEIKLAALRAYPTQFLANAAEPHQDPQATYIASADFWALIASRSHVWGHRIGAAHGEPFLLDRPAHAHHPLAKLIMSAEREARSVE